MMVSVYLFGSPTFQCSVKRFASLGLTNKLVDISDIRYGILRFDWQGQSSNHYGGDSTPTLEGSPL